MPSAKDIIVKPIKSSAANALVKRVHYSGKVAPNSQLHFGVYLGGRLEGAMQLGPSLDKRKMLGLVEGTAWNGFLELNRMAFSDRLPRNSESRAISVALRMIRAHYPHLEWIVSFADATQCGDGTIYRAAGFLLTGLRKNSTIVLRPDGTVGSELVGGKHTGGKPLSGYQLRYMFFLNKQAKNRLTVPVLPFSKIEEVGAAMYKGTPKRAKEQDSESPSELGGATPTRTLHTSSEAS